MSRKVAIGIDLGTTYSCVGVFRNGRVDVIANEKGSRITASFVAFNECERLVGDAAKEQAAINPKNTVFEAKRIIGRKFADVTVQKDMKQWPFEVLDDKGSPKIKVQYRGQAKILTAEEISACVLRKLKEVAEAYIGDEVDDAVITVPAYFNDSQRQATIDAGKIAGLNVLSIINEPTAAALAYGYDKKISGANKNILIFDLGGGTFDVVVLTTNGKSYDVKAVGGDTHLGGGDFDAILVQHFLKMIERKNGKDLSKNPKALSRLRKSCEYAKIGLSGASSASIDIECLVDGEDFRGKITRKRFEELCSDLFEKTITHVKSVIADSNIDKKRIDEVILVGGSSRIPKIQELLSKFFDGKKLNATINPDEAVAYGAAVKAALVSGEHTIEEITLADVVPLSLGLKSSKGDMVTFIKRNSRTPITVVQKNWTLAEDYQMSTSVQVHEGERKLADDNNHLGSYLFDIGERALAGVPKLTFIFTVDENGILHVSGENENNKCRGGLTIRSIKGRLTKKEIQVMKRGVEKCSARPMEDAGLSMEALEAYCLEQTTKARAICANGAITSSERDWVLTWCDEALEWLEDNENLRKEDYEKKLREMKFKCGPVFANAKDVSITSNQ